MTETARPSDPAATPPDGPVAVTAPPRLVDVAFPAPAPASTGRAGTVDGVALVTLDRPEALNALELRPARRPRRGARARSIATRVPGDRDDRIRHARVRRGRRHPRARRPDERVTPSGGTVPGVGPDRRHRAPAHRGRSRLRARWWVRARDGVRHDRRGRRRDLRPARDPDRRHAGCRRYPASDPRDRKGPGDGDRSSPGRTMSAAKRTRSASSRRSSPPK